MSLQSSIHHRVLPEAIFSRLLANHKIVRFFAVTRQNKKFYKYSYKKSLSNVPGKNTYQYFFMFSLSRIEYSKSNNLLKEFQIFYFPVKYLREVTPYFRKTSILSELAWGTGTLSREGSLGRNGALNDKVTIPLRLCFACRGMAAETVDRRTFELHSHDLKNCCQFRCSDEAAANQWLQEIHATLYALTQHAISDANRLLNNDHLPNSSGEIRHMGWLAQQVS